MLRRLAPLLACLGAIGLAHAGEAPGGIKVGKLHLRPCIAEYDGYCGTIHQPLDRSGGLPGALTIGFEFYPHTDTIRPPLGVILAQENSKPIVSAPGRPPLRSSGWWMVPQ